MSNKISGLTESLIKKVSPWFLYIFIPADARLSSRIMAKRKRQIELLQWIDKVNIFKNMDQLVSYVHAGIMEKYKLTPQQVLSVMHIAVNTGSVAGMGNTGDSYFDGTNWVDESGAALPLDQQIAATELANDLTTGSGSTFLADFKEIVDWIVELLQSLGLTKKTSTYTGATPNLEDWDTQNEAGIGDTLPYVIGAGLIYYLYTKTKKKQ